MIRCWPALIVLLCSIGEALSQDRVDFRDGTATAVSRDARGNTITAKVQTAKLSIDFPFRKGYRWGAEIRRPATIVTVVEIRVGDREVFVPLSAYADLAEPRSISLQTVGKAATLSILGGDASVAYEAVLTFAESFVSKRRVHNRAFPDTAWEETKYSYTQRYN